MQYYWILIDWQLNFILRNWNWLLVIFSVRSKMSKQIHECSNINATSFPYEVPVKYRKHNKHWMVHRSLCMGLVGLNEKLSSIQVSKYLLTFGNMYRLVCTRTQATVERGPNLRNHDSRSNFSNSSNFAVRSWMFYSQRRNIFLANILY